MHKCERPSFLLGFNRDDLDRENINLFCFSANMLDSDKSGSAGKLRQLGTWLKKELDPSVFDDPYVFSKTIKEYRKKAFQNKLPHLLMLSATPYNLYPSQQTSGLEKSQTTEDEGGRTKGQRSLKISTRCWTLFRMDIPIIKANCKRHTSYIVKEKNGC